MEKWSAFARPDGITRASTIPPPRKNESIFLLEERGQTRNLEARFQPMQAITLGRPKHRSERTAAVAAAAVACTIRLMTRCPHDLFASACRVTRHHRQGASCCFSLFSNPDSKASPNVTTYKSLKEEGSVRILGVLNILDGRGE